MIAVKYIQFFFKAKQAKENYGSNIHSFGNISAWLKSTNVCRRIGLDFYADGHILESARANRTRGERDMLKWDLCLSLGGKKLMEKIGGEQLRNVDRYVSPDSMKECKRPTAVHCANEMHGGVKSRSCELISALTNSNTTDRYAHKVVDSIAENYDEMNNRTVQKKSKGNHDPTRQMECAFYSASEAETMKNWVIGMMHWCAICSVQHRKPVCHNQSGDINMECYKAIFMQCRCKTHRWSGCPLSRGCNDGGCFTCSVKTHDGGAIHPTNTYGKRDCPVKNFIQMAVIYREENEINTQMQRSALRTSQGEIFVDLKGFLDFLTGIRQNGLRNRKIGLFAIIGWIRTHITGVQNYCSSYFELSRTVGVPEN